ncbi:predicted protein [Phaeodactylum tricornutum CCAP 1055/1]|uniref:Uncharacterized protein n=2 Tax=Phaeodactylum tricornutum TaxID=2850 RepID=B7S4H1_PHATC|nr:predicted protein [Phaeodactylum tricornutum CCAP 1055/1]EEC42554.1 predicted protein [Phaeodactylum tricornutum CCAP 1055/1]|eukprot:XP_002176457.1 predicted protein [Phaeodactylum tricornutum CCAP 1055/1]
MRRRQYLSSSVFVLSLTVSTLFGFRPFSLQHRKVKQPRSWRTSSAEVGAQMSLLPTVTPPETIRPKGAESLPFRAENVWEKMALKIAKADEDPSQLTDFVQLVSILRVGFPALALAIVANLSYPPMSMALANVIDDSGVFAVISQDASQYIQNILTTSGLVFALLVGQTYYFMYQQQEKIYLALFQEVTIAKSLVEQVSLVCRGRETLYSRIMACIDRYVKEDLTRFNDKEPAELISARPCDDPLEDILYLTSVGEPSIIYQTVRSLRQARAFRLGALQRKLPALHMTLLWVLGGIVLCTFPLLGAGSQTIGGMRILIVQAWYLSFIVFGMALTLGVIYELQRPGEKGAYNARMVLTVMVAGLEEELAQRLNGDIGLVSSDGWHEPSIDGDGAFEEELLMPKEF